MELIPVDCYCYTHADGILEPLKIQYVDENDDLHKIKIDRLVLPGPDAFRYEQVKIDCGTFQDGRLIRFKLVFDKQKIKWFLSK